MSIDTRKEFLLFIEPSSDQKSKEPVNDKITETVKFAMTKAVAGASNYGKENEQPYFSTGDRWRGFHVTDCGETSTNQEYLLENKMVTNSLSVFYLQWYRDAIPPEEMEKVNKLVNFYRTPE